MTISEEMIINKLEERVLSAKKAVYSNQNEKLIEDLISIKAYCDLVLEARKQSPSIIETKLEQKKTASIDQPDSESLFDF